MAGTLYLVPTPIGNLGDISRRIADTLGEVDFIAAEDTRVTLKLLNHLGLKKPMLSYYRHNTGAGGEAVLSACWPGRSAISSTSRPPSTSAIITWRCPISAANGATRKSAARPCCWPNAATTWISSCG